MTKNPWTDKKFAKKCLQHIDKNFLDGTEKEVEFLINEMGLSEGNEVLDLGCGAGRHSIELAKRGFRVTGIDVSKILINEAKMRSGELKIKFILADLRNISKIVKSGRHFKGVICLCESGIGTLGLKNDLLLLRKIHDLLYKNGKFVWTTFNGIKKYRNTSSNVKKFDYINGEILWETPEDWKGRKLKEVERVYTPSEAIMLLSLSSFKKINIYGCSSGNFNYQDLEPDDIEMMVVGQK